jgi:hypothetical protein
VVNKTVVVTPERTVKVKLPNSTTFVTLTSTDDIPVGTIVDTKVGAVTLTSIPREGAAPQTAKFYDGIFKVAQSGGITTLTLVEPLAPCGKGARTSAKKPKTRRLWGSGKGNFRTTGNYSAATIRGTKWLVQDSCSGTLTKVAAGVVSVRDKVRRKTVVRRAGQQYLARPRR